jgi:hypothetical protein
MRIDKNARVIQASDRIPPSAGKQKPARWFPAPVMFANLKSSLVSPFRFD